MEMSGDRMVRIDASKSIDEVYNNVKDIINKYLDKK